MIFPKGNLYFSYFVYNIWHNFYINVCSKDLSPHRLKNFSFAVSYTCIEYTSQYIREQANPQIEKIHFCCIMHMCREHKPVYKRN